MEPSAAIAVIETELRALVKAVYAQHPKSGPWIDHVQPAEKREDLAKRRTEETKRRAPANVPQDLLEYTHFYELRKLIAANWDWFVPILGSKREFEVWADRIEDYRNAPAHSRELLAFERALLEGIAGHIRTRVSTFRSSRGPDMNLYPVIESATDSFGNIFSDVDPESMSNIFVVSAVLTPGDEVSFKLRAWDPQDRRIDWELSSGNHSKVSGTGTEVTLVWQVSKKDVSVYTHVRIRMTAVGEYHRFGSYDGTVTFRYRVDPPAGG